MLPNPAADATCYLSDAMASRRFSVSLMAIFALAAMALAVTGIYAVVGYAVSQRARELRIRLALGASRASIVRLLIGGDIRYIFIGLMSGNVLAGAVTLALTSMFFGVAPTDAATFYQVTAVVTAAAILASGVPSVRAGRLGVGVLNE
jgi:ABC-type antimicrobial peptide transport system permease subunit